MIDHSKIKILIIEDDSDIRDTVRLFLNVENYECIEAGDGFEGLAKMGKDIDLVILDIMMPVKDGFEVCREIRADYNVPILFLTAKSSEQDIITGLEIGGDDYIIKPFSYAELLGRINAMLRRCKVYNNVKKTDSPSPWIRSGDLRVSTDHNNVYVGERKISLTETEYEMLRMIMSEPSRIFSSEEIHENIWHEKYIPDCANTIMVHIRNIRSKIEENPSSPKYILTVWGKGYRFGEKIQ